MASGEPLYLADAFARIVEFVADDVEPGARSLAVNLQNGEEVFALRDNDVLEREVDINRAETDHAPNQHARHELRDVGAQSIFWFVAMS